MPLQQAGVTYDDNWVQVELGEKVLEEDFSIRPITAEEKAIIQRIADDHSASK